MRSATPASTLLAKPATAFVRAAPAACPPAPPSSHRKTDVAAQAHHLCLCPAGALPWKIGSIGMNGYRCACSASSIHDSTRTKTAPVRLAAVFCRIVLTGTPAPSLLGLGYAASDKNRCQRTGAVCACRGRGFSRAASATIPIHPDKPGKTLLGMGGWRTSVSGSGMMAVLASKPLVLQAACRDPRCWPGGSFSHHLPGV